MPSRSKVGGQRPQVTLPDVPQAVVEEVRDLLQAQGITEVQHELLQRFMSDAAKFAGDPGALSVQEARLGVAMYLEQTGKVQEGARVMAAYARPLGFEAEPKWSEGLAPAARKLLRGLASANAEQRQLAKAAASITDINGIRTNGYSTQMFTATGAGGTPLFLRATQAMTDIDHWEADRSNNLVNVLSHQMQAPNLVMASVVVPVPDALKGQLSRDNIMVLPRMPSEFTPAGSQSGVSNPAAAQISEDDRVSGAVLSYLLRHTDARANNVQVDGQGHTIFIDHDNVLDRPAWFVRRWGGVPVQHFFKGQGLAYTSDLSTYDKLPARVKTLIDGLSTMSPEQVSSMYGATEREATVMLQQAQRIKELGLEGAIARYPVTPVT